MAQHRGVLTFELNRRERRRVMSEVSEFARRLRHELSAGFPYWYSPELHPGGHGWHVNFFVPHRIEHALVESVWGQGFVWVTDFERGRHGPKGEPLGLCATPREGWRPDMAASMPKRTGPPSTSAVITIATRSPKTTPQKAWAAGSEARLRRR